MGRKKETLPWLVDSFPGQGRLAVAHQGMLNFLS
jgi:hypothetical protein